MTLSYRKCAVTLGILLSYSVVAWTQRSIPLIPGSAPLKANEKIEVEQVEIGRFGAFPSEIHRKSGRFVLAIINKTTAASQPGFIVESSTIGDLTLGSQPLLRIASGSPAQRYRSAAILDAPVGSFDLKSADNGKIVCKIIID